jgi:hypothetical protein
VNPATTRTRTAAQRQAVLGLVVDAAPIDAAFGARLRTTAARMDWRADGLEHLTPPVGG